VWERVTGGLSGAAVFRGRADRYTDLALMDRSLRSDTRNPQYGSDFADRYLARCGHDAVDYDKLDFYRFWTSSSELRSGGSAGDQHDGHCGETQPDLLRAGRSLVQERYREGNRRRGVERGDHGGER
jgi:hypothetical protein